MCIHMYMYIHLYVYIYQYVSRYRHVDICIVPTVTMTLQQPSGPGKMLDTLSPLPGHALGLEAWVVAGSRDSCNRGPKGHIRPSGSEYGI